MKKIFAKRLRSARLLAGLSQDKLVEAMGGIVSKNAISKYERGEMMPTSKILIALSKALSIKTDYFFRPFTVEIENVEFRKRSRLNISKVKAIKQMVSDQVERYIEIEELLNIPFNFTNPLANHKIKSKEDVEEAVNFLLRDWELGFNALPNVIDLLEDKEIKVIELDEVEKFDGLSGMADGRIPIVVINSNFSIERKRFTALHELAHLLLNFDSDLKQNEIEKLCHCFAGAMLMPQSTFINELGVKRSGISFNELISIKETYGISVQAIMARAKSLGVISESKYVSFCIQMKGNKKEDKLGAYKGKEQSDRFSQLIFRAASEELISMSKAANLANTNLASFRDEFMAI